MKLTQNQKKTMGLLYAIYGREAGTPREAQCLYLRWRGDIFVSLPGTFICIDRDGRIVA